MVTLELIKQLRDATGVSITECKKALEETGGNIDAAIDELRKKGIAKAGKRSENATHEGRIIIRPVGNVAYVASLTCETDFVARTDNFTGFINELLDALVKAGSVEAAKEAGTDEEKARQVAMHTVATNPNALRVSDFPVETIAHEKEVQLDMMKQDPKNAGKPEDILAHIIEGKMKKFVEEGTLMTQPFVVNPEVTIEQYLGGDVVTSYKRYSI